jgi:chromosome segregation ATPase
MKEKLQNDIDLLRAELSKIENTEGSQERFKALNTAIDQLQKDVGAEHGKEVNEQLNQVVTNFEIDHPVIHGLLRNVMKTLGDIGI